MPMLTLNIITQVRFANEVHDFVTSPEFDFVGLENEDNHEYPSNPRRLGWNLDSESIDAISDATKRANDLISSVDYAVIQSDAINSSFAKSNKLSPAGLLASVAVGAAIEAARAGAGKVSDIIDEKMQEEFDKVAKTSTKSLLLLFLRDVGMAASPLVLFAILPIVL